MTVDPTDSLLPMAAASQEAPVVEISKESGGPVVEISKESGGPVVEISKESGGSVHEISRESGGSVHEISKESGGSVHEISKESGDPVEKASESRAPEGDVDSGTAEIKDAAQSLSSYSELVVSIYTLNPKP